VDAVIVHGACRPGTTPPGQDRWIATERSAIVLDGASAFEKGAPPADAYVDALLTGLAERIDSPEPIPSVLAAAIDQAAREVHAVPGTGPSSTVAIVREEGGWIDAAVLGDSTIVVGLADGSIERHTDDRMDQVALEHRERYRERLRTGAGYDEQHRATLGTIQTAERAVRNQPTGYWIAEAEPDAAHQLLITRYMREDVRWCVLATDGAQRGFDHLGIPWENLPAADPERLRELLDELHQWESGTDPSGAQLPRAKRHDDKTVVTWSVA
jgi:hypothetical protein